MPGEHKIIHYLSFPKALSVSSFIPTCNSTVQYESIKKFIQLIKHFDPYALMAKMDIKVGFRNMPIHPSDYYLLGFNGKVTFDLINAYQWSN